MIEFILSKRGSEMRSPDAVFQDLEADRALRENEIRLIENIANRTENDEERKMLRRSLSC